MILGSVSSTSSPIAIGPVPLEFILFGLTLLGVAIFHSRALLVSLIGLGAIATYKVTCTSFSLGNHIAHEADLLLNLFGLLVGFAILASFVEHSGVPERIPHLLPKGWAGALGLLAIVFVMSAILDNIAAALIGASIAKSVFSGRVHIGFLAAIVAASNAGGAPSVIGDTTTTMLWLAGIPPQHLAPAVIASLVSFVVFGVVGAIQQDRFQPIRIADGATHRIEKRALFGAVLILIGAILANLLLDHRPAIGVWIAILVAATFTKPHWKEIPRAASGALFLSALVLSASMMTVDALPAPSSGSVLGLAFVSSVFDNIPLTKLAIDQNGYDWALLAFAVGFGGSITWFGSSAGVAVANVYPEAKSMKQWLRQGWHVPVACVVGFVVMLWLRGWCPEMLVKPS